jgi:hypothetical protein
MSYNDHTLGCCGASTEPGLGIAPAIVASLIPLASKLVGLIRGLFTSKPSPEQLARAQAQAQLWVDHYVENWAIGDRLRIDEIKRTVKLYADNPAMPSYMQEVARNTLTVISQYDAANPTPPQYEGPLIVAIKTDSARFQMTPLYVMPEPNTGFTQVGVTSVKQPNGTTTTVPLFLRDPKAPITPADVSSSQNPSGVVSGPLTAGVLGSGGLLIFGGLASLLFLAASTDKRR